MKKNDSNEIKEQKEELITDEQLEAASGMDSLGLEKASMSNTGCRPAPCGC
jgi:hypothetical protein